MIKKFMGKAQTISKYADAGLLEKATIYILKHNNIIEEQLKVQFNPQSYQISRGAKLAKNNAAPPQNQPPSQQTVGSPQAYLSVSLVFDTYTEYGLGQSMTVGAINGGVNLGLSAAKDLINQKAERPDEMYPVSLDVCDRFMGLIHINHEQHTAPEIAFVWGTLSFQGKVVSAQVDYTMFARDGTPLRAVVKLVISGEETRIKSQNDRAKLESPDRTKRRTLEYGDQLWTLADQEYGDPGKWKAIAQANGILNPRKLGGSMSLQVPSIR